MDNQIHSVSILNSHSVATGVRSVGPLSNALAWPCSTKWISLRQRLVSGCRSLLYREICLQVLLVSWGTLALGIRLSAGIAASLKFLLDSNGPPLTSFGTVLEENSYLKKKTPYENMLLNHHRRRLHRFTHLGRASQADDTTITINGHTQGVTPFISNVHLTVSEPPSTVLKELQFTIHPKPGSVTRPLSGTYANYYLIDRGFENQQTGDITLPVYGLYDGYQYRYVDLSFC